MPRALQKVYGGWWWLRVTLVLSFGLGQAEQQTFSCPQSPPDSQRKGKMAFQGPILEEALKFHLDSTQPNFKIVFMDWLPPTMAIFRGIFWAFGWVPEVSLNFPK